MNTKTKKYKCICCGYYTFEENIVMMHDICPVCFWENDGVQNFDPAFSGGANEMSLNEARENFKLFGAIDKKLLKYLREPLEDEKNGLDDWVVFG